MVLTGCYPGRPYAPSCCPRGSPPAAAPLPGLPVVAPPAPPRQAPPPRHCRRVGANSSFGTTSLDRGETGNHCHIGGREDDGALSTIAGCGPKTRREIFGSLFIILKPGEQHGREEQIHQAAEPSLQGEEGQSGQRDLLGL